MRITPVFITLGWLAACPRSRPPAPPERPPPGCTDLARNDMPRNDMPRNDMPRNDMPRNGLTGAALHKNEALLQNLAGRPFKQALDEAIAGGSIPLATVDDPYATRKLLKYIAACALDPCEKVAAGTATNPIEVYGELGLCGDTYNSSESAKERPWRSGPPTEGCKQRVSACVIARVNAVGASVRLSMRGDGLNLAKEVGVDTIFRENHGTDIVSFKTCHARGISSQEPSRNCDWVPRHVGRCVPGDVTIKAAGRIRVCAGVYGCDDTITKDVTPLVDATGAPHPSPPRYGGTMLASGADSVTIQCPGNGPLVDGKQTGYFAVMIDATQPQVTVSQAQDPLAEYPASEAAAFTYREGAFYGDLFAPRPVESSPDKILFNDQYACYSDVWTLSGALLADRLCANVTAAKCFGNTPGPCVDRCTALPGDPRVEDTCSPPPPLKPGPPPKAFEPYTVYLNNPCDLASDYDRCITLAQHTPHN